MFHFFFLELSFFLELNYVVRGFKWFWRRTNWHKLWCQSWIIFLEWEDTSSIGWMLKRQGFSYDDCYNGKISSEHQRSLSDKVGSRNNVCYCHYPPSSPTSQTDRLLTYTISTTHLLLNTKHIIKHINKCCTNDTICLNFSQILCKLWSNLNVKKFLKK